MKQKLIIALFLLGLVGCSEAPESSVRIYSEEETISDRLNKGPGGCGWFELSTDADQLIATLDPPEGVETFPQTVEAEFKLRSGETKSVTLRSTEPLVYVSDLSAIGIQSADEIFEGKIKTACE